MYVCIIGFPDAQKKRGYPDSQELVFSIKNNCPQYENIAVFLQELGNPSNNRTKVSEIMGQMLKIEGDVLNIMQLDHMLQWAKTQERNGWGDMTMRDDVLLPLFHTILPNLGLKNVKEKWVELIGPKSLTGEKSKYYDKLKSRLLIGSIRNIGAILTVQEKEIVPNQPIEIPIDTTTTPSLLSPKRQYNSNNNNSPYNTYPSSYSNNPLYQDNNKGFSSYGRCYSAMIVL